VRIKEKKGESENEAQSREEAAYSNEEKNDVTR
jgi:hypothetical protein